MEPQKNITGLVRQKTYFSILQLLNSIISNNKYADMPISKLFKSEDFSSSEKAAVFELTYGILRHRARIDHIIENASSAVISSLELNTLNTLRICTYQALFKDVKATGVINNAVALSAKNPNFSGFIKRTIEGILRNKENVIFPDRDKTPIDYISTYHSHPLWIVEKWAIELEGTGGPAKYIGRDMRTAHAGLSITESDWQVGVNNLTATFNKFNVPQQETDDMLAIVSGLKSVIVEI
ncbi:MAG TPA: transcription antitermination factor NusB [archaeon]|nr:transcription antitermination factor NusB [archaeon]